MWFVECVGDEAGDGDAWEMVPWRRKMMIENDFGSCVFVLVVVFVRRHRLHCYY